MSAGDRTRASRYLAVLAALGAIFAADVPSASAQVARMERGPSHDRLSFLEGRWTVRRTFEMPDGTDRETTAQESYAWNEPGRVWLERRVSGEHPVLGTFWGLELWAYDAASDEYVKYWFDNQSAHVFVNRGGWVDEDTLELTGQMPWDDTTIYMKNVYDVHPDGSFTWTHYQSWGDPGRFEPRGVSVYTRPGGSR